MSSGFRRGATPQARMLAAEREARASQLLLAGWSYAEIAKELGYKEPSGARKACERARAKARELGARNIEDVRTKLERRLDRAHRVAVKHLGNVDPRVSLDAAGKIQRGVDVHARVSGVVKAPPSVVIAPPPAQDLSALDPKDLMELHRIQ